MNASDVVEGRRCVVYYHYSFCLFFCIVVLCNSKSVVVREKNFGDERKIQKFNRWLCEGIGWKRFAGWNRNSFETSKRGDLPSLNNDWCRLSVPVCRICWVSKCFENAWRHVGLDCYYLLRLPFRLLLKWSTLVWRYEIESTIDIIWRRCAWRWRFDIFFLFFFRVAVAIDFLPSYNRHWTNLPAHSLRPSVTCVKFNVLNAVKPTPAVSN